MGGLSLMTKKAKFLFSFILIVLIIIRIIYINTILYNIPLKRNYSTENSFEYNEMIYNISNYKIYTGEELNQLYNNDLKDIVDDYDIIFNITITNATNKVKKFNASATGIMYDCESGGNANPYLYKYFNENLSGILEILPNETITVTLSFPYPNISDNINNIQYIISLYPEKIFVKL